MSSNITTTLSVDPPLIQDADWRFDDEDRKYIDDQNRGVQQHLVDALIRGRHATWVRNSSSGVALLPGDVVCVAAADLPELTVTKATPAALATATSAMAVVVYGAAPGAMVLVANGGLLPRTITGLAVGAAGLVRVGSDGRCERVTTYTVGDYGIGAVGTAGVMIVIPGVGIGATGGSGEVNIGNNVGDGADIYRDKTSSTLNFRGIKGIGGITAAVNGDNVEIDGSGIGGEECADVTDFGAVGDGIADDAPAIRAAMAAAKAAGHYRVCFPPAASFYRLSTPFQAGRYFALFVNEPYHFIGRSGARHGNGKVILKCDAGLSGIAAYEGKAAEGGSGGRATFEGIEVSSAGLVTTRAYAASTAYSVGEYIKGNDPYLLTIGHSTYTGGNEHVWEVIKAGTTAATPEASAYDEGSSHTPDRATTWGAGRTIGAGAIVRSTDNTHWNVFFIANNSGTTHASTEPTWDYTPGNTTGDNGITWLCLTDPNILVLGSVIARVRIFTGIMAWCPVTIRDCCFKGWQNAGVMLEGNKSTPIIDSDAIGCVVDECDVYAPLSGSGLNGLGFYIRGGGITGARFSNCQFIGSAGTAQGTIAMPTGGTQHQHGFLDRSFLGGNTFTNCSSREAAGYEFWLQGTAGDSCTVGFQAFLGRVRHDAAAFSVGLMDAKYWSIIGGPNSYSSTGTTIGKNGLQNAYETSSDSTKVAYLNDDVSFFGFYDVTDSGALAWRILSGWNYFGWAGTSYSPIAIANRQVGTSANLPMGQEGGSLTFPRGFGLGPTTDEIHVFPSLSEYTGSISYNERGGYRRVGDRIQRPDRSASGSGAYSEDVVTVAGYCGPTWTANTAVLAKVNPGSSSAHLATVVAPTSGANLNRFKCTTAGTTGVSEPNWASAPSVGNTVADGTAVWTNTGTAPTTVTSGYLGTISGGGGEANTMSSSGGTASIVQTKVGVNLPVRGFSASSPIVVTQNTNDLTFSLATVPVASGGTGLTSVPGSNGNPLINNSGAIGAATTWFFGTGLIGGTGSYIALNGGTVSSTGWVRGPYNSGASVPIISVKNSGGTDCTVIGYGAGDALTFGNPNMDWTAQGFGSCSMSMSTGGYSLIVNGNTHIASSTASGTRILPDLSLGATIKGDVTTSNPLRVEKSTVSAGADPTTLTAAQYCVTRVEVNPSVDCDIIFPTVTGAFWFVKNTGGSNTIKPRISSQGAGTGPAMTAGQKAIFYCTGATLEQLTNII